MRKKRLSRPNRKKFTRALRIEQCERREMLAGDVGIELVNLFDQSDIVVTAGGSFFVAGDNAQGQRPFYYSGVTNDGLSVPLTSDAVTHELNRWVFSGIGEPAVAFDGTVAGGVDALRRFLPDPEMPRHSDGEPVEPLRTVPDGVIALADLFDEDDAVDQVARGNKPTVLAETPAPTVRPDRKLTPPGPPTVRATRIEHGLLDKSWAFEVASAVELDSKPTDRPEPAPTAGDTTRSSRSVPYEDHREWLIARQLAAVSAVQRETFETSTTAEADGVAATTPVDARDAAFSELELTDVEGAAWWGLAVDRRYTWAALAVGVLIAIKTWGHTADMSDVSQEPRPARRLRRSSRFLIQRA